MFCECFMLDASLMIGFSCNQSKRIEIFLGFFALAFDWSGEDENDCESQD